MDTSNELPVLDTLIVLCPSCGGHCGVYGYTFGDTGWHPCYRCGDVGQMLFYDSIDPEPPEETIVSWQDQEALCEFC